LRENLLVATRTDSLPFRASTKISNRIKKILLHTI
jgi:hypothetical protein